MKAVFFDRDGILVKNINGEAPKRVYDLALITETIPVILDLQKKSYKTIIISNQPDMALGNINERVRKGLVKKFEKLLKGANIPMDIYYCFHHPDGIVEKYRKICNCRKPKPGMILKAIKKYNIDAKRSYLVGDRATDIKAGNLAGIKTILIDPENLERNYLLQYKVKPDFIIKKIDKILNII